MQEAHSNKHPNDLDDEIDLRELFYILWGGKWIIVSITAFASIVAVVYSLSLPNIYESKALLAPVSSTSSNIGSLRSYNNLTRLAGINLSPGTTSGNTQKAIQKIGTLSFFENNILPNINLPDLMAVKYWNFETNKLIYDKNIYDSESNIWVRDYSYPKKQIPSAQESYYKFKEHLSLGENQENGFISITIRHQSPIIAKQWSEIIINEANNFYRLKDKLESQKALQYLNQQILLTGLSEIKETLAQLIQEHTKRLTLIEANEFHVFDYIDPPAVLEKKSGPNRAIICIIIAIMGGVLGVLFVLIRHYANNQKSP